jgi:gluconokinase
MVIVIMGVSGCGKTTVGRLLAEELGWSFYEGDDFHPPENVAKMRKGIALNDSDRRPWLEKLQDLIVEVNRRGESAVLTCSALKASYRGLLREADDGIVIVYLRGDYELIRRRMKERRGHYMPVGLLESQLAELEEPERAIEIEIGHRPEEIVKKIEEALCERGEAERPACPASP